MSNPFETYTADELERVPETLTYSEEEAELQAGTIDKINALFC